MIAQHQVREQLKGPVQVRRMQQHGRGFPGNFRRCRDRAQNTLAADPRRSHRAKRRSVIETEGARKLVMSIGADVLRPNGQIQRRRVRNDAVLDQMPRRMRAPRIVVSGALAADDGEATVGGIQHQAHRARAVGVEQQRRQYLEVLDDLRRVLGTLLDAAARAAGGKGHFDEAGGGEDGAAAHGVIGVDRQLGDVQVIFPMQRLARERVAQQRMHDAAAQMPLRLGGGRVPVTLALPRIERQVHITAGRQKPRLVAQCAAQFQLRDQRADARSAALLASQGRHHQRRGAQVFGDVGKVGGEHGARADLDEGVHADIRDGTDRRFEIHRLANVAPPVRGAEVNALGRRDDAGSRHRRVHRDGGVARLKAAQGINQARVDRIHGGTVKRIIQRQTLEHDAALRERGLEAGHGAGVARQGDALRAVDRRDREPSIQPQRLDQHRGIDFPKRGGRHAARPSGTRLMRAAFVNHAYRLLQSQRAAGPGRSHFADAVAADGNGVDSLEVEQAGQTHLQCEQCRLRDFGQRETILIRRRAQFREYGFAGDTPMQGIDLGHGVAKIDIFIEQLQSHAGPLRTVARIDECGRRRFGAILTEQDAFGGGRRGVLVQGDRQGGPIHDARREPMRMDITVHGRAVDDVGQRQIVAGAQMQGHLARRLAQSRRTARREQQCGKDGGCDVCRRRAFGLERDRRLETGQHGMCIGAAETEGADADDQPAIRGQRELFGHGREIPTREVNGRVGGAQMNICRHDTIAQHVQYFDEPRHAGGGLEVSDVALDRSDGQRLVRRAPLAQRFADGTGFERIAHRRTGTVRLVVIDVGRRDTGAAVDITEQRGLGLVARYGET